METAFPLVSKDDITELYGYCNVIMDQLRPLTNSNWKEFDPNKSDMEKSLIEPLLLTLNNFKVLIDEILQTPEQKFDAFSEGLKNYKPKSDPVIVAYDKTLELMKGFVHNNRYDSILKTALESILPRAIRMSVPFTIPKMQDAISTAFQIANEVEVKYQELDDLKKQVEYETTYGG
jgi:hypothetical protein